MMEKCPIEVIMPVYNTGIYLEEALDSLFAQSFTDFGLICVDDASDDETTREILAKYESMYGRMRAIRLEERVSAADARNIGFSRSMAEYVIFLDSDDLFHKEMLGQMYEEITRTDSEVCFCGFRSFAVIQHEKLCSGEKLPRIYDSQLQKRPEDWLTYSWKAPWNKLIKRKFLEENNIGFQALSSADDIYFSVMLETKAKRICYCRSVLMDYRIDREKQMSVNRDPMNFYRAMERVFGELHMEERNALYPQFLLFLLDGVIGEIVASKNEISNRKAYETVQGFLRSQATRNPIMTVFYKHIYNCFLTRDYESQWFRNIFSHEFLYDVHEEEIRKAVDGHSRIVLWGMGVRGNAFQSFCETAGISLSGCVDLKSRENDVCTKYGVPILKPDSAAAHADLIVACNKGIYDYVLENTVGIPVINLQEYEGI